MFIQFSHKKVFSFFIAILSIVGYGTFVFSAQLADGTTPPSGGYLAGDSILDPGCAPGSANCYQNVGGGWSLTGNAGTTAGTNFIGTTDAEDFIIKVNSTEIARFGQNSNIALVNYTDGMLSGADGNGNTGVTASGAGSIAWGGSVFFSDYPIASGQVSTAWGIDTQASGIASTAFGQTTLASGAGAFAWGNGTVASGGSATAWGDSADATSNFATAWGASTLASNDNATAWGSGSTASGIMSTAFGQGTTASSSRAASWGFNTIASGQITTAFGSTTIARSYSETAIGTFNTDYTPNSTAAIDVADRLFLVGNGTSGVALSDAFTILKNGKTGIGYDSFETTTFDSLLQVNGAILSSTLAGCVNPLAANTDGKIQCGSAITGPATLIGSTSGITVTGTPIATSETWLGYQTGQNGGSTLNTVFIGLRAGDNGDNAHFSVFEGYEAGKDARNANAAVFIGTTAGNGATNAGASVFLGGGAGLSATNAANGIFIGSSAGNAAVSAEGSILIGTQAGNNATNATRSIFIGYQAGNNDIVNNTSSGSSILIGEGTSTGGFSNSIALGKQAANSASNQLMIGSNDDPAMRINTLVFNDGTGNTCAINASTGITCSSDERLKTDIVDLSSSTLDAITQLRTVKYKWNSGPEITQTHIGFIAQNMQQYFPELVTQNADGMLSVNYANITPVLAEGIKELDIKIKNIQSFTTASDTSFLNTVKTWLASETNGILNIFSKKVTSEQICLKRTDGSERCITAEQVDQILGSTPSIPSGGTPTPDPAPTPTPDETLTPQPEPNNNPVVDPTPDPIPTPSPDDTPILEPEPNNNPVVDPTPEPIPETTPVTEEIPVE